MIRFKRSHKGRVYILLESLCFQQMKTWNHRLDHTAKKKKCCWNPDQDDVITLCGICTKCLSLSNDSKLQMQTTTPLSWWLFIWCCWSNIVTLQTHLLVNKSAACESISKLTLTFSSNLVSMWNDLSPYSFELKRHWLDENHWMNVSTFKPVITA